MSDLVTQIFQVCLIPLLGVLTAYAVSYLKAKQQELTSKTENATLNKYLYMLFDTVNTCVVATNQTYVDALKAEGKFDEEAQKNAFEKTYNAVLTILSNEAKTYITSTFGDLEQYLIKLIEESVKDNKASA